MDKRSLTRLSDIVPDERNANVGTPRGMGQLEASLRKYGAGRSIVVDKRGRVIAGNKTLEKAAELGLEVEVVESDGHRLVVVQRTDLDLADEEDGRARGLAYADNRITETNLRWDVDRVREDWDAKRVPDDLWTVHEIDTMGYQTTDPVAPSDYDDLPEELPGASALKPSMFFRSDEIFNIPRLLPDMLAPLPEPIDVWAGPDASDSNWQGWWLYCYGSDSVKGLDMERTVMAFYVDDYRFERWFDQPDKYVGKALNVGIPLFVTPNFTLFAEGPGALNIFNIFRGRYIGRYIQEAGIPVIPDVCWGGPDSWDYSLAGIPKGAPCLSIQVQKMADMGGRPALEVYTEEVLRVCDTLEPESLLIYGGGRETKQALASALPATLAVCWLESRVIRRSKRVMHTPMQGG